MTPDQRQRVEHEASRSKHWATIETSDLRACLAALDAAEQARDKAQSRAEMWMHNHGVVSQGLAKAEAKLAAPTAPPRMESQPSQAASGYSPCPAPRELLIELEELATTWSHGVRANGGMVSGPEAYAIERTARRALAALTAPSDSRAEVVRVLEEAARALRIDANRLCDRNLGGTYEDDCRLSIHRMDEALAALRAEGEGGNRG